MNIVFIGFDEYFAEIPKALTAELPVKYALVVSHETSDKPSKIQCDHLDIAKIKTGRYEGVDWSVIRPLDGTLIEAMAGCEMTVMKMMERLGPMGEDVFSYDERKRRYMRHLRFWNHMLQEKNISCCIFNTLPHAMFDYVIYELCKYYGVNRYLFYRMPTLPKKCIKKYLVTDYKTPLVEASISYQEAKKSGFDAKPVDISPEYEAYFVNQKQSGGGKPVAFTGVTKSKSNRLKKLAAKLAEIGRLLAPSNRDAFRNWWRWRRERQWIDAFYSRHAVSAPNLTEKYIYVALHYQPECTTSPMAGVFVDQLLMIQMLAYALPKGMYLYVKDHPRHSLVLDRNFCIGLSQLPNVRLIDRTYDTFKLIDSAVAVATGTGTAGWEALLRGKPVLMFGYYFYQYAPGVFRVKDLEDCRKALTEIIDRGYKVDERELRLFLKSTEPFAFDGFADFRYRELATIADKENTENTVQALVQRIRRDAATGGNSTAASRDWRPPSQQELRRSSENASYTR